MPPSVSDCAPSQPESPILVVSEVPFLFLRGERNFIISFCGVVSWWMGLDGTQKVCSISNFGLSWHWGHFRTLLISSELPTIFLQRDVQFCSAFQAESLMSPRHHQANEDAFQKLTGRLLKVWPAACVFLSPSFIYLRHVSYLHGHYQLKFNSMGITFFETKLLSFWAGSNGLFSRTQKNYLNEGRRCPLSRGHGGSVYLIRVKFLRARWLIATSLFIGETHFIRSLFFYWEKSVNVFALHAVPDKGLGEIMPVPPLKCDPTDVPAPPPASVNRAANNFVFVANCQSLFAIVSFLKFYRIDWQGKVSCNRFDSAAYTTIWAFSQIYIISLMKTFVLSQLSVTVFILTSNHLCIGIWRVGPWW